MIKHRQITCRPLATSITAAAAAAGNTGCGHNGNSKRQLIKTTRPVDSAAAAAS